MEAEESVMSEYEIDKRARQQEIEQIEAYRRGFKAGERQAKTEMNLQLTSLAELCMKHRKEGIREVVDWIEHTGFNRDSKGLFIGWDEWQAQLEKWGIDENRTAEDNQETRQTFLGVCP